MEHVSVYVTCPDETTALHIARELLEQRLIACANHFPIRSVYRWQGDVVEGQEHVMFLKTRREHADAVVAAVAQMHPDKVPCAVVFELRGGHAPYLSWVDAETA